MDFPVRFPVDPGPKPRLSLEGSCLFFLKGVTRDDDVGSLSTFVFSFSVQIPVLVLSNPCRYILFCPSIFFVVFFSSDIFLTILCSAFVTLSLETYFFFDILARLVIPVSTRTFSCALYHKDIKIVYF